MAEKKGKSKKFLKDIEVKLKVVKLNHQNGKELPEEKTPFSGEENVIGEKILVATESFSKPISQSKETIFEKIGKNCLYILIFLLPFFFLPITVLPIEINKYALVFALTLLSFICYLIGSFYKGEIIFPKSLLSLAVLVLLAVVGLSAVFSKAKLLGLFGDFSLADTFLSFLIYGLVFFLAFVFLKEKEDVVKAFFVFLAGLVILTIFGILQLYGKFFFPFEFTKNRAFNPFGSVFGWGILLAFGLTLVVAVLNNFQLTKKLKIGLSLAALLFGFVLFALNYWLIWLGLVLIMMVLVSLKFLEVQKIDFKNFWLPVAVFVVVFLFLLLSNFLPNLIGTPIVEVRPSFQTTIGIIKGTLKGWQAILGAGPGTFVYQYDLFKPISINQTNLWQIRPTQGFSFAFSLPIIFGVLGTLAFLFLIFSFLMQFKKIFSNKIAFVSAISTLFLIIIWFFYPASFAYNVFVFLGLGISSAFLDEKSSQKRTINLDRIKPKIALIYVWVLIILLVLSLGLFYIGGRKYLAAIYYSQGLQAYNLKGDLTTSLAKLEKAKNLDPFNDQYLVALSQALVLKIKNLLNTALAMPQLQESFKNQIQNSLTPALENAKLATQRNPLNSANWSNLASVYEGLILYVNGADDFSEANYQKAISLNPLNPDLQISLGRSLTVSIQKIDKLISAGADTNNQLKQLKEQKIQKAYNAFLKAINLKNDYAPAYYQMGYFLYNNGNFDEAQKYLEAAVQLDTNYANARYFLGLIYDRFGQNQKAIEQFEKVLELNPNEEGIKVILENLKAGRHAFSTGTETPNPPPANQTKNKNKK